MMPLNINLEHQEQKDFTSTVMAILEYMLLQKLLEHYTLLQIISQLLVMMILVLHKMVTDILKYGQMIKRLLILIVMILSLPNQLVQEVLHQLVVILILFMGQMCLRQVILILVSHKWVMEFWVYLQIIRRDFASTQLVN